MARDVQQQPETTRDGQSRPETARDARDGQRRPETSRDFQKRPEAARDGHLFDAHIMKFENSANLPTGRPSAALADSILSQFFDLGIVFSNNLKPIS